MQVQSPAAGLRGTSGKSPSSTPGHHCQTFNQVHSSASGTHSWTKQGGLKPGPGPSLWQPHLSCTAPDHAGARQSPPRSVPHLVPTRASPACRRQRLLMWEDELTYGGLSHHRRALGLGQSVKGVGTQKEPTQRGSERVSRPPGAEAHQETPLLGRCHRPLSSELAGWTTWGPVHSAPAPRQRSATSCPGHRPPSFCLDRGSG